MKAFKNWAEASKIESGETLITRDNEHFGPLGFKFLCYQVRSFFAFVVICRKITGNSADNVAILIRTDDTLFVVESFERHLSTRSETWGFQARNHGKTLTSITLQQQHSTRFLCWALGECGSSKSGFAPNIWAKKTSCSSLVLRVLFCLWAVKMTRVVRKVPHLV